VGHEPHPGRLDGGAALAADLCPVRKTPMVRFDPLPPATVCLGSNLRVEGSLGPRASVNASVVSFEPRIARSVRAAFCSQRKVVGHLPDHSTPVLYLRGDDVSVKGLEARGLG
jgi:hypothetical protein